LWLTTNADLVLRATIDGTDEVEVARKRIPLSLDLLALPGPAQTELELALDHQLCVFSGDFTDFSEGLNCIAPHAANNNPRFVRLMSAPALTDPLSTLEDQIGVRPAGPNDDDATSGGRFSPVDGTLTVHAGDRVSLRPVMANNAHEAFQRIDVDERTGTFTLTSAREDLAFSWFTTVGNVNHLSDDKSRGAGAGLADVTLVIPQDVTPGPAFVWVVARDQRGGVDWLRMQLDVQGR